MPNARRAGSYSKSSLSTARVMWPKEGPCLQPATAFKTFTMSVDCSQQNGHRQKKTNFMGHVQPTKLISLVRSLAKRDEENESANNKIPTRMRKVSKTSGQWVVRMTNKNHADKPMCCFWPCTLLSGHCSLSLSSSRLWPNDTSATLHIILDLYSRLDPCHLVSEPITLS